MNGREQDAGRSEGRGVRPGGPGGVAAVLCILALATVGSGTPRPAELRTCVVALRMTSSVEIASDPKPSRPEAVAVDHHGRVLIADTGNNRVLVLSSEGDAVGEFGGYGWQAGRFDAPTDISLHEGFYIYVLDEGNRRVQRFDVRGDFVDVAIEEGDAGTPVGIEVGQAGELLIVDDDRQAILTYSQFDEVTEAIGRFGQDLGGLVRPADVAVGPSREIAVADPGRGVVAVFDEFGSPLRSLAFGDSLEPDDVLFDPTGCLFAADAENGLVLAFPPRGQGPTAVLGRGDVDREFAPSGMAFSPDGSLIVLDRDGGRILTVAIEHGECPRSE